MRRALGSCDLHGLSKGRLSLSISSSIHLSRLVLRVRVDLNLARMVGIHGGLCHALRIDKRLCIFRDALAHVGGKLGKHLCRVGHAHPIDASKGLLVVKGILWARLVYHARIRHA